MTRYQRKQVIIEAITFDEFVDYGRHSGANIVNSMPWSFVYKEYPVSHETDTRYLISTPDGTINFTDDDMLITSISGKVYPCKKGIFNILYEVL